MLTVMDLRDLTIVRIHCDIAELTQVVQSAAPPLFLEHVRDSTEIVGRIPRIATLRRIDNDLDPDWSYKRVRLQIAA